MAATNSPNLDKCRNTFWTTAESSNMHWSLERYQRAVALDLLDTDDRVELLAGNIVNKVPIDPPHAACVSMLSEYFYKFSDGYVARTGNPVLLPPDSMPEPDCVIVPYREDFYASAHPSSDDVHLIIEVANSSVSIDRHWKGSIYAQAGLAEYWIVNIRDRKVEVHLEPDVVNGSYEKIQRYRETQVFESPFAGTVAVTDLVPPI